MTDANIICGTFFLAFLFLALDRIRVSAKLLLLDGGDGPC